MGSDEPYEVFIDERALKELKKAFSKNKPLSKPLTDAIRALSIDRKSMVKRLTGITPALYRKRFDNWRIIFAQSTKMRKVNVLTVRLRNEDTYEQSELKKIASKLGSDYL